MLADYGAVPYNNGILQQISHSQLFDVFTTKYFKRVKNWETMSIRLSVVTNFCEILYREINIKSRDLIFVSTCPI